MNIIQQLNAFITANPTAKVWVEEVLFRGGPGTLAGWGIIKGAHFQIGVETENILGQRERKLFDLMTAAQVPDEATQVSSMAELIGVVTIQQQRTVDQLTAENETLKQEKAALELQLQNAAARIAELTPQ